MRQTIGMRLRQLRKSRNLTIQDVIANVNCSQASLYRYERVENDELPTIMLHELARFYNVDTHWLRYGGGFQNVKPGPYEDTRPYVEIPYDFKWAQPMIDAYCNADASTQKAVCAVLGLERILPQKTTTIHYLTDEELQVDQKFFDQT